VKKIQKGICKHCEQPFETTYKRVGAQQFCNRHCYDAYRKVHGVPSRFQAPACHPDRKYVANGLCKNCYDMKRYRDKGLRVQARDRELRKIFGITLDEYNTKLEAQDFKCMICGLHKDEQKKALGVDHNHTTLVNRDLLCNVCNTLVGHVEKLGFDRLNLIVEYLERHAQ
jgi:hypothetical protein